MLNPPVIDAIRHDKNPLGNAGFLGPGFARVSPLGLRVA